jgi:hypothetical protein
MQRIRGYCFFLCFLLITFYACKKEYSYEGGPVSSGYCTNIIVAGRYLVGKDLTDSNFGKYLGNTGSYDIVSRHRMAFHLQGQVTMTRE